MSDAVSDAVSDDQLIEAGIQALHRRMSAKGVNLSDFRDLVAHGAMQLRNERREVFVGYFLDRDMRLIAVETMASGAETEVSFSVRDAARKAIAADADSVVFVHNHPNGNTEPSDNDRKAVARIDQQFSVLGILPAGHFVVAGTVAECIRTGQRVQLVTVDYTGPRCPKCDACLDLPLETTE